MATSKKTTTRSSAADTPKLPSLEDFAKMARQFKLPGVDVTALVEWQRKDMEALAEANRQAYEGMKALVERRNEILRDSVATWQNSMKDAMGADALAKQSKAIEQAMKKAMADFKELAALETKARTDAWKVVQQRMQDNMKNLQQLMQPKK